MLWPGIGTPAGNLRTQISATTSGTGRAHVPAILGASDIWLVGHKSAVFINSGGTALSASHKWVGTLVGLDAAGSSTGTVSTISYDSGSSNVFREQYNAIAAVKAAGTIAYQMDWTKTGTPGNFAQGDVLYTRIIAT
jgi:hypothetical protein